jgi:hypothetical protein
MGSTPFGATFVELFALVGVFVIIAFVAVFSIYLIFFFQPSDNQHVDKPGGTDGRPKD